jgi:small subunit ribosomal protein S6
MTDSSKKMREYETIYIMRAELDDKLAKEFMLSTKELVERLGGKNLKVTAMGRKRLAWERKKEQRGIYVMHSYLANPGMVGDFERALSIDDKIFASSKYVD